MKNNPLRYPTAEKSDFIRRMSRRKSRESMKNTRVFKVFKVIRESQ